jgi:hypothetical protein
VNVIAGASQGREGETEPGATPEAVRFGPLPPDDFPPLAPGDLADALAAAFATPRLLVPSAWTRHLPFLFALIRLTRPRRFVELGTHHGCSFFGAVQAVEQHATGTECIAVDTWEGDHQAGHFGSEVHEAVQAALATHFAPAPQGGPWLLRSRFSDAAPRFAPGSIDLLHIDGLHTYEAVREDWETWRPKLSARAIVLFHDTRETKGDFGVWRLWAEISAGRPSLDFAHEHGLGVLYAGRPDPAVDALFARVAPGSEGCRLICSLFAGLGEIVAEAGRNAASTREGVRAAAEAALAAARAEAARAEIEAMRRSRSWRLTAPLRRAFSPLHRLGRLRRPG